MAKRKRSPQEFKLLDRIEKEQRYFERSYTRMRRAVAAMEKARQRIVRCRRALERLETPLPQSSPT